MNRATRVAVRDFLEHTLQTQIERVEPPTGDPRKLRPRLNASEDGKLKPFHEAVFPDGMLRIQENERSFSTALGSSIEAVARLVGTAHHAEVARGYEVRGMISSTALERIDDIIGGVRRAGEVRESFTTQIHRVLRANGGRRRERRCIVDLYLKTKSGNEYFFEMKSPKPNKGQCLEATQRLLQIHTIKGAGRPKVNAFYAMAYNPFGSREEYTHSFARNYMDFDEEVLIGGEFWDIVGGRGTYDEVLDIYREVGAKLLPSILEEFEF